MTTNSTSTRDRCRARQEVWPLSYRYQVKFKVVLYYLDREEVRYHEHDQRLSVEAGIDQGLRRDPPRRQQRLRKLQVAATEAVGH